MKYTDLIEKQKEIIEEFNLSENTKELITFNLENNWICSTDNEVKIFTDTVKFYANMLKAIENAKDYIYAEYYIIRDDESGRAFVNMLTKKAMEGLKVRLLYDDIGCMKLRKDFFESFVKGGGKLKAFLPSRIKLINRNLNYRNHRKMLVVDGICAYIGSSNLGDEHLGKTKLNPWSDCNIRIKGTAAMHISMRAVQDYNFSSKNNSKLKPVEHNIQNYLPVQVLFDGPDTPESSIYQAYIKAIYGAKKRVYIQTPYFIPDTAFMLALATVAKSGIDVRVIIPQIPDKKYVYYATLSYAYDLVKKGVKVYKKRGFLHSKTMLIDDEICSLGSFNIDVRSFNLQFEMTAMIYDKKTCNLLLNIINSDIADSEEIDLKSISLRPVKQKILERIMRLATPLM